MILSPEQYPSTPVCDLLRAAAAGQVAIDHRFLHAIIDRGPSVADDFARFFSGKRDGERLDIDADLLAIVRHLHTPAALPFLAELARQCEFQFTDDLTMAFTELGGASLEPLLELQKESNDPEDVEFALAALGVRDSRILDILLAALKRDPAHASLALGLYGDPAAKPALEELLASADPGNEWLRRDLQSAIDDLSEPVPPSEPTSYDIWADYDAEDEPHFAALDDAELLEFFASPVASYRSQAVRMLATGEPDAAAVARVLELARTDPEVSVRAECWEALEGSLEESGVSEALHAVLDNSEAPLAERCGALVALALEANDDKKLYQTIVDFYGIPEARAQAIKAMWHSMDRRFAQYIPQYLDDADPKVRRQAIWAVGWLGIVSQLGKIEKLFDDDDLREAALYAYALAAPGAVTVARTRSLYKKIEDLACGFSDDDDMVVRKALDDRLQLNGLDPVFLAAAAHEHDHEYEHDHDHDDDHECTCGHHHEHAEPALPAAAGDKPGRNEPCPCGSGKKYKKCCGK